MMPTPLTFRVAPRHVSFLEDATAGTVWLCNDAESTAPALYIRPQTLSRYFGKPLSPMECRSLTLANQAKLNAVIEETTPAAAPYSNVAEITLETLAQSSIRLSDAVLTAEWPYQF